MVLKNASVLSCLLPARLGFGSGHRSDSPSRARNQEKHAHEKPVGFGDPDVDPFRGIPPLHLADGLPDLSRVRANTAPSDLLPPPLLIPNGGIGESPGLSNRSLPSPPRPKRSSFTTFFAFSSKRRSTYGVPITQLRQDLLVPSQAVPGRWVSDDGQTHAHLANPASIPSPLRTDGEDYYYSYAPLTPSHSVFTNPDTTHRSPSKQSPLRQRDVADLDSQLSSPVDPPHAQIRHPYAYSTPLYTKPDPQTVDTGPRLRHATSQPLHHHPQYSRSGANTALAHTRLSSSHHGHETSRSHPLLSHPELKTSMSTPNLASGTSPLRLRSLIRKKPSTRSKGQERWLSAESWWDALFSPSPRFKVKRAPRPNPTADRVVPDPVTRPVENESNRNLGVTFPSIPAPRPRAASVISTASNVKHTVPALTRSRSAANLSGEPSTSVAPRAGFEPALETLVDQPTPPPDHVPDRDSEPRLPDPPLSLEEVLDEGDALEQQRAQWKQQATKSLGNKHTRSFSRARSKSLGEKHGRLGHHASENSKAHLNLEFLAARTLLGSQSTMPVVHVAKPSSSSSYSKAYSHSHSQSAHSYTHSSYSRPYSHSHSHSLTTSNSSKSSRNLPPRGHSRNGSWSKTALLKAGALCGIGRDDSYSTDEQIPSSSRVDVQGTIIIGHSASLERASDADKVPVSPNVPVGEVGIAISSSPPPGGSFDFDMSGSPHREDDHENRPSSKHTHKSSEYAGPHPSAIDSNLPQLGGVTNVSLRHRLPPRPAIHPPIAPIAHPYRSAMVQFEKFGSKASQGAMRKSTEGREVVGLDTGRSPYPHISLSHADFGQYGVGEALVYASGSRPKEALETKQADVQNEPSPVVELPSPEAQTPSCETAVLQSEERDTSSLAMNSVPSLTNSTIQMVMSAFNNPDDLDEFQDLFYKPGSASVQRAELGMTINQVPTDVHGSTSSSPLAHLVRKLSEEVNSLRDPPRTPSDPVLLQKTESQDLHSSESETNFVFMDLARSSSSPPPMEPSSQLHVPIQKGSESTTQPTLIIPEDVNSFYTSSVLESPTEDNDNDTFGYPVKHGQLEVTTAPAPIQSPMRVSTHLSIQEDVSDESESAFLSPLTKRLRLVSVDAVRASYLTMSDVSRMSGLSEFPLPPSARPHSMLHAHDEMAIPSSVSEDQSDDGTEMGQADTHTNDDDGGPSGDVGETLRALRMTPRVTSYESRPSTFGGSDDMDFITQLHQAGP